MRTDPSKITERLQHLVAEGKQLVSRFRDNNSAIGFQDRADSIAWMFSAVHVLELSFPDDSRYRSQATRVLPTAEGTIFPSKVATILGILTSATSEWSAGLIGRLEFHYVGLAFEDFLRLAVEENEKGRHEVAGVLASAVFEDAVKRLCRKHGIEAKGKNVDQLLSALKSNDVLAKNKTERLKSHIQVRNPAFHAQWDDFDQHDVRQMIGDLDDLLETHFR